MSGQIAILRLCQFCDQWRSIEQFRKRTHICRDCNPAATTRSTMLTDKGVATALLLRSQEPTAVVV